MPAEASGFDVHAEEMLDLLESVSGAQIIVLRAIADHEITPREEAAIHAALGTAVAQSQKATTNADRLAAASRLVRSIFYTGCVSPWIRRVARESDIVEVTS